MRRLLFLCALVACRSEVASSSAGLEPFAPPAVAEDLDPDPDVVHVRLRAEDLGARRYAYNGTSPGPTIRVEVGDTLMVELVNELTLPTTIHWHGVYVPFEMDGVTWMRDPVMPGQTFTYVFSPPKAGTFWYHPHFDTAGQVDGGLYGMLIVEDPAEPEVEEIELIFDAEAEHRPGVTRGHGHGRLATPWRINGVVQPELHVRGGTSVRTRLVNASNAGYLQISHPDLTQIGSDQGLLPEARAPVRLLLAPGDRADLEWRIGETGFSVVAQPYSLNGGPAFGEPEEVLRVVVEDPAPAPQSAPWPFPAGEVTPDPGHTDILYALAGSDRTRRWLINGETFPNVTIERIPLGSEAIVEIRNVSPSEHPFHLHGLSFEVLSVNGVPPDVRTVEDTYNLRIRDRVRVRVLADNPGDWMTHCHILPHAEEGMMTVLRVE